MIEKDGKVVETGSQDSAGELEDKTGYRFQNPELLTRALTRLAYSLENNLTEGFHMDALATLGDAAIDLVILESLVKNGMNVKGELSISKTDLVNMTILRKTAENIGMERYVRWGRGETVQHIWTSGRVMAECFEALAGAAYLDGGIRAVEKILLKTGLV
jgi:ribonuclease III